MAPFWHPFGERKNFTFLSYSFGVGTGRILIPCTNKYVAVSLDMPKNGIALWSMRVSKLKINAIKKHPNQCVFELIPTSFQHLTPYINNKAI